MSTSGKDGETKGGQEDEPTAPQDLIDFYGRWRSEFRKTAMLLSKRTDLSVLELQTIHWMILLVDRVGPDDLEPRDRRID